MASLALTTRFITTCSSWPRSASARREIGCQGQRDLDVLADQPAEHARHFRDQPVHIERRGVQHLLTAEREQLFGEARRHAGPP